MVYADELTDLFNNFECAVEQMRPEYPKEMILYGDQVREFLAYKFLKFAAEIKMGD
jgi:hypothetical protein